MADSHDPIPGGDHEFDDLQSALMGAVSSNAVAWNIPSGDITDLTGAQTAWAAAWNIAKNKQNATPAQLETKDVTRSDYEKLLRPFIQKWIYRNKSMTADDIKTCGLKPHDSTRTPATKIGLVTGVTVKRGIPLEIIAECPKTDGAHLYGCIVTQGAPLPGTVVIDSDGQLLIGPELFQAPSQIAGIAFDLTEQRIKHLNDLEHNATYYIYFFLVNTAGVSPLTQPVSIVCW